MAKPAPRSATVITRQMRILATIAHDRASTPEESTAAHAALSALAWVLRAPDTEPESDIGWLVRPDVALAHLVGRGALPVLAVHRRFWAYVKEQDLQDKKNRRNIIPDAILRRVLGRRRRVSIFEVTGLLGRHMTPVGREILVLADRAS